MIHVLTKCPVCTHQLKAVKLTCESCGTHIENTFDFPAIMHLTKDQLEFIEVFIRSRGNIKDVEKALNISYPTVRAKLDQVIEALGPASGTLSTGSSATSSTTKSLVEEEEKQKIVALLESGEITAQEALERLNPNKNNA